MDDFPTKHRDVHKNVKLLEGSPFIFHGHLREYPIFKTASELGGHVED